MYVGYTCRRIREKYEVELDELEKSERQAMEKYNQMKAELLEAQGDRERLKVLNKQKEQEVDDIKRVSYFMSDIIEILVLSGTQPTLD